MISTEPTAEKRLGGEKKQQKGEGERKIEFRLRKS
jgi:hypothetical protein